MIYIINGKRFNCVLDAMEYRDILDANYINVEWKQFDFLSNKMK